MMESARTAHPRRQIWTSYSPPWELKISQRNYRSITITEALSWTINLCYFNLNIIIDINQSFIITWIRTSTSFCQKQWVPLMWNSWLHAKQFQFSHKSGVTVPGPSLFTHIYKNVFPPSPTCSMPEQKVRQRSVLRNTAFYQRGVSSKDKLIRDRVIRLWKTDGRRV
jgi:hypothetical protein